MEINARFVCRQYIGGDLDLREHVNRLHGGGFVADCRCPVTVECEWVGDERGATTLSAPTVFKLTGVSRMDDAAGKEFVYGGLQLQVVDVYYSLGAMCDAYVVMLADNPHAELKMLYRRAARWLLRKAVTAEARVRGFMLQPYEGRVMPIASKLAEKML